MTRKKLKLPDLLAQCDPAAPYAGEVWADAQPVGREFGAPPNPTDSVWPTDGLAYQESIRAEWDDPTEQKDNQ